MKVGALIKSDYKYGPGLKMRFEDSEVGAVNVLNCQTTVYDLGKLLSVKQ